MDAAGGPQAAPPMRAGDGDRAAAVHVLQDAVARGLLTPDEGSERMAAAWAAVHLRDLRPLTADLPAPPAPTRPVAPGWRPLGLMAWEQVRTTARTVPGRPGVRLAVALVLTLLLLVGLGAAALDAVFDGGPGVWEQSWDDDPWDDREPR